MGCMKHPEDAAIVIAAWGEGTIRIGHRTAHTVWREGEEEISATDSVKRVVQIVRERERELNQLSFDLSTNERATSWQASTRSF